MEMEQLVSKITAEILRTMQNQGSVNTPSVNTGNVAGMIDHTLQKQNASEEQIVKLCQEAKEYHFCSVCVNPCYVPLCYEELRGSGVKVCTVIGFPLGAVSICVDGGAQIVQLHFSPVADVDASNSHRSIQ